MLHWRKYILLISLIFTTSASLKAADFDHSHKLWSELLGKYVDDAYNVRYKSWKADQKDLDSYLASLSGVSYATYQKWTRDQKMAFLINSYNAFTVKLILDNYPVKSIRKIGGLFGSPWKKEFFSILDGKIKSLDPIEHEWLRKKKEFKDPRVHAAVNCASVSCPVLQKEAFVAENLDAQMTSATKQWLSDKSRNRYNVAKNEVEISKIFDWFSEDFGDSEKEILKFLQTYGPEELKKIDANKLDIDYLDYDWNLNAANPVKES